MPELPATTERHANLLHSLVRGCGEARWVPFQIETTKVADDDGEDDDVTITYQYEANNEIDFTFDETKMAEAPDDFDVVDRGGGGELTEEQHEKLVQYQVS